MMTLIAPVGASETELHFSARDNQKAGEGERAGENRMAPQDDPTQDSVQSYAEQWAAETPFLQTLPTILEAPQAAQEPQQVSRWYETLAPFREEQETVEGYAPEAEDFVQLLAELRDEEFDEAVERLVNEASDLYHEQFVGESGALVSSPAEPEGLLEMHFEPLVRETERLVGEMAEEVDRHDLIAMSEAEIDTVLSRYGVSGDQLTP